MIEIFDLSPRSSINLIYRVFALVYNFVSFIFNIKHRTLMFYNTMVPRIYTEQENQCLLQRIQIPDVLNLIFFALKHIAILFKMHICAS